MNKLDRFKGSLVGGAVGDALGYAVEFYEYPEIVRIYGEKGITKYKLNENNKAVFSDDTQMTLYTANGIILNETHNDTDINYVAVCYKDWLRTQTYNVFDSEKAECSWLNDIPELCYQRAPGNTCINAILHGADGTAENPINNSKGCGGIMRVAPAGLYYSNPVEAGIKGAEFSAITHGHPLGYMPSFVMAYIISRITYEENPNLLKIILDSKEAVRKIYNDNEYISYLIDTIDKAILLSQNENNDVENIHSIGGGWVAEETLGIALYCCLKYEGDFDKAIISSVNHSGDSDSTGAIVGNIMGALYGYDRIPFKWKKNLELLETIVEIAQDLCEMNISHENWQKKYMTI